MKKKKIYFWEKYYTSMLPKMSAKALASESIKELSKNNKIYLITARWDTEKKEVEKITIKWLADNEIVYDKLILKCRNKTRIMQKYNIDLFIDDSFKNCKRINRKRNKNIYNGFTSKTKNVMMKR